MYYPQVLPHGVTAPAYQPLEGADSGNGAS
jgi:hypothetical protein